MRNLQVVSQKGKPLFYTRTLFDASNRESHLECYHRRISLILRLQPRATGLAGFGLAGAAYSGKAKVHLHLRYVICQYEP